MDAPDWDRRSPTGDRRKSHKAPPDLHREAELQSLLAAIVESSNDAIIGKNTEGIITTWNRAAQQTFGYTAEEAIGQHVTLLAMPGRQQEMIGILSRVLSGERVSHFETVRRHKDGHPVLVSLTVSPIQNNAGIIIGASKIARDITERKRTEQLLQQTEKLAMLGRLSSSIAHEINNPLEAVTNLLFLLRNYPLPLEGQEYLRMAEDELARVGQIVSQTLAFHKQNSHSVPADMAAVLDSALSFLSHRLRRQPVRLIRKYSPVPPLSCFEGEIRQVLLNLIGNALDAIQKPSSDAFVDTAPSTDAPPPADRLIVALRPATDWRTARPGVRITVADNGSGIPSDVIPHIFEAFFTTKGNTGTGLGLWISAEVIRHHQGRISVRSSHHPDRAGTVFAIFLPHTHPGESPRSRASDPDPNADLQPAG